jgi:RNA polymerase sigma factor (sigma-70 family)
LTNHWTTKRHQLTGKLRIVIFQYLKGDVAMAIVPVCQSQREDIFACVQAGCPECLEVLMREHTGLIYAVIQQPGIGGIDYVDLEQEGRIGLWQAILHYEPERGYAFSSYAWAAIRHQVWHAIRQADGAEEDPDEEVEAWLELVDEIEDDWWRQRVRQALLEVVEKLPERLGEMIRLAYGLDGQGWYSLAAIGRQWGISRERVRQLRNDALSLLRLPALSMQLRNLCERDSCLDYQQALCLSRVWQRSQRRRP